MKILLLCIFTTILFGSSHTIFPNSYKDLKLVYIIADNSYRNVSTYIPPNTRLNYRNFWSNLKYLHTNTFRDIRKFTLFLQRNYGNLNYTVEFKKDDIISELTGIVLYEALKNIDCACTDWKQVLIETWTKSINGPPYVFPSIGCNNYDLQYYINNEGRMFLKDFVDKAKAIKNKEYTFITNKIFSANNEIFYNLLRQLRISDIMHYNEPSKSLQFELYYDRAQRNYEIRINFYPGFGYTQTRSFFIKFDQIRESISVEEFERMLNVPSTLKSCNVKVDVSKSHSAIMHTTSAPSTTKITSTSTPSTPITVKIIPATTRTTTMPTTATFKTTQMTTTVTTTKPTTTKPTTIKPTTAKPTTAKPTTAKPTTTKPTTAKPTTKPTTTSTTTMKPVQNITENITDVAKTSSLKSLNKNKHNKVRLIVQSTFILNGNLKNSGTINIPIYLNYGIFVMFLLMYYA